MKDMTQGNPTKLILGFAIPMLIGNIFQQIYNVVDTLVVGRYLGANALAGVGSTGTLTGFLLALVMGLNNGAGLIVAQSYGCRDTQKMKDSVVSLIWINSILAIFISLIGLKGTTFFLRLLGVPEEVLPYSVTYLKIMYAFVLGSIASNGASAILRSTGDSKTPLYIQIIASLLNVVLDLFFILQLQLGVAGVAYATIISQFFSAFACIFYLFQKRGLLGLTDMHWLPKKSMILCMIKTGFPSAFQTCMISIGGMSVQKLVNSFGSSVMAAYVTANKIDSVAIQVIVSIGTALSVFTGQNIGKNQFDRIKDGLRKTLALMMLASVSLAICVLVFRYDLMKLFLEETANQEAVQIGASYLSIIGIAYVIAGIMQSYQNVIRGAGDVNACMIAGLTELGGRIVFAYLLSHILGVTGIWIATPLSWSCGCIIPVLRYYSGKWKSKKLV